MKILEICIYSSGVDGVFARVKQESLLLAKKGHEVRIFSSNNIKGSSSIAPENDKFGSVVVRRFPTKKMPFNESYILWDKNLKKEIIDYKPEIIIAHSYRHTHTVIASRVAKNIGAKCFLVTHAPFGADENRSLASKLYIKFYHDLFVGKPTLKRFDKIIAITTWEIPYLLKLGVKQEKISYIPNGIPDEFFKIKKAKEENKILFLGRISPIKDIETLIRAIPLVSDKKIKLEIVGMAEKDYLTKLKELIRNLNLSNRIIFSPPVFDIKEKIKKIDSARIFVLPSKREGMPQSLVEAMSRGIVSISSNNLGSKELIVSEKNGYLFKIGDEKELGEKINHSLLANQTKLKKEARKSVEQFSWGRIIDRIDRLINQN